MNGRSTKISKLKSSRASRAAYIKGKLSVLIPAQIRALRLKSSTPKQGDLAREAEMRQSRISAMEKPGAVNYNLETLVRVASALKVGLIVKFVSFSEMLSWENHFSQDAFSVVPFDKDSEFISGGQVVTREVSSSGQAGISFGFLDSEAKTGIGPTILVERKQELGRVPKLALNAAATSGGAASSQGAVI